MSRNTIKIILYANQRYKRGVDSYFWAPLYILEGMLKNWPKLEKLKFSVYYIIYIDPPTAWFGKILTLGDDISLGVKPFRKYHHFGLTFAESPSLRAYKW